MSFDDALASAREEHRAAEQRHRDEEHAAHDHDARLRREWHDFITWFRDQAKAHGLPSRTLTVARVTAQRGLFGTKPKMSTHDGGVAGWTVSVSGREHSGETSLDVSYDAYLVTSTGAIYRVTSLDRPTTYDELPQPIHHMVDNRDARAQASVYWDHGHTLGENLQHSMTRMLAVHLEEH